jgi:hypothetical protein
MLEVVLKRFENPDGDDAALIDDVAAPAGLRNAVIAWLVCGARNRDMVKRRP